MSPLTSHPKFSELEDDQMQISLNHQAENRYQNSMRRVVKLKIDLRTVSKGDAVFRRPICNVATRSMKMAKHEKKMRIALTPVTLTGNHDQKSRMGQRSADLSSEQHLHDVFLPNQNASSQHTISASAEACTKRLCRADVRNRRYGRIRAFGWDITVAMIAIQSCRKGRLQES